MISRRQYFSRIAGRVDLAVLSLARVLVVGIGSVGSAMVMGLARAGVGHFLFIDGHDLQEHNFVRHEVPSAYLGQNKAVAMATHLQANVPNTDVAAIARHVDDSFDDLTLDALLQPADLVIVATDERTVQRRVAERALAMDKPAIVPGLYGDEGGEVFVQLGPALPCFLCWDSFREPNSELRGVRAMYADALNVIQEAIFLSIAVLDTRSGHARELAPERGDGRPRQLFVSRPGAALVRVPVQRRPSCPSCAIGPSPFSDDEAGEWHVEGFDGAQWRFAAEGDPTPPVVAHVAIDQQLIMRGDPVEISWSARNATHVLIDGVGRQPAAGSAQIMLTRTNRLRIEAVNPFGQTTAHTPVVRVLPRPVLVAPRVPDVPRSMMPSSTLPPLTPPVFTLPEIPPLAPTETPVFLPPPMLNLHR